MLDLTQFEGHAEDSFLAFINHHANGKDRLLLDKAHKLLDEVKRLREALEKIHEELDKRDTHPIDRILEAKEITREALK